MTEPRLAKQDGSLAVELDRHRHDRKHRREQEQRGNRDCKIENALLQ
jgi:hypothetical protein